MSDTKEEDEKLVSLKDRFKLVTDKVINTVTGDNPEIVIDDRTLMKCYMASEFYKSFAKLYPTKTWVSWERTPGGFKITLHEKGD